MKYTNEIIEEDWIMKFDNATILAAGVLACMKDYRLQFAASGRPGTFEQILEVAEQAGPDVQDEKGEDETAAKC